MQPGGDVSRLRRRRRREDEYYEWYDYTRAAASGEEEEVDDGRRSIVREGSVNATQASGPRNKRELETTATEETAIMAPAADGLRVNPYSGKRAPAASGTPTAL